MAKRKTQRVLILGGGVAGLAAAQALRRQAPQVELCLLEARDRLGGRVWTEHDPLTGEPLELGAEFVHGRSPEFLAALDDAGVRLVEDHQPGDAEDDDSPFAAMPRLLAPELERPRDRSLLEVLRAARLSAGHRAMLQGYAGGFYLARADQASARALAGMELAQAEIDGERAAQLEDGYQPWINTLAQALRPGELRLGTAAEAVHWRPQHVEVLARSRAGARLPAFVADAAIVAVPFTALDGHVGSLRLRPALREHQRAARSLQMGVATKVLLRFAQPLELEDFLIGPGAVPVWWTPARSPSSWVVGWAGGPSADSLERRSDASVVEAALGSLAGASGHPKARLARELTGFRVARWAREPHIRGAYAVVPVGADGAMEQLAQPVADTLFFAGEATHPGHAGTVHGAYETGVRAARQASAALGVD